MFDPDREPAQQGVPEDIELERFKERGRLSERLHSARESIFSFMREHAPSREQVGVALAASMTLIASNSPFIVDGRGEDEGEIWNKFEKHVDELSAKELQELRRGMENLVDVKIDTPKDIKEVTIDEGKSGKQGTVEEEGEKFTPDVDLDNLNPDWFDENGNYKNIPTYGKPPIKVYADEFGIVTKEDFLNGKSIAGGPTGPIGKKQIGSTFVYVDADEKIVGYVDGKTGERVLAEDIDIITSEELSALRESVANEKDLD